MRQKWGKFVADWREEDGTRKTKHFLTIGEALAWKETNRRKNVRPKQKYHTAAQRREARLRKHYRWRQREALKNPLRGLFRKLGVTEYDCTTNGLSLIGIQSLIAPKWFVIGPHGKRITERLETPEHLIKRLKL